jgi:hypothetical protein
MASSMELQYEVPLSEFLPVSFTGRQAKILLGIYKASEDKVKDSHIYHQFTNRTVS